MTVSPGTPPVPLKVGVVSFVRLSVLLEPESLTGTRSGAPEGADGAVVSTETVRACDNALAVPPGVTNRAEMACTPSASTVPAGIVLAV